MNLMIIFRLLAFASLTPSTTAGDENYSVCTSEACLRRAKQINDSLNTSVDPCVDFYAYACGGWEKNHAIPAHRASYGLIEKLADELLENLKSILESMAPGNVSQNITDKLAAAYNSCMAFQTEEDEPTDMINILETSGLDGWPITANATVAKQTLTNYTEVLLKTGIHPVLEFYVGKSVQDSETNAIQVDQIGFQLLERDTLLNLNSSDGNFKAIADAYKEIIKEAIKFVKPNASHSELDQVAGAVLNFEQQLANLTTGSDERWDLSQIYVNTTIRALQENFSSFPLHNLLNKEFSMANVTLTSDETIEIYALDYYYKLTQFLPTVDPVDLFNYAGFRVMVSLAGHGSKSLRDAFGYPSGNERWKECVKLLKEAMPEIVGYVYVLDKFSAKAKKEVEGLAERIKQAYKDQLQRSDWMDNKTKQAAQEKLSKMAAKVGYPEWQLNTTYLEELYQHVPHLPLNSSFLKYWHEITQNNWIRHLRKLRESPVNTSDWIIGPAEVNAFYSPNSNELVYPSAILQSLFYEPGLPWSLNMGSLGAVMAHEMTHGFDLNGGQFDAHGKFTDWWSNGTRSSFHKKADCFRKQYENITDPDANMTLNSEQTLNEDIADNGGLRIALTAYERMLQEECDGNETRLKDLEYLSGRKLFFIGNAMTWCGITEEQRLKGDIHYSKYSPNKYRVIVPTQNLEEFASTFNCSSGSPMNPTKKCLLW